MLEIYLYFFHLITNFAITKLLVNKAYLKKRRKKKKRIVPIKILSRSSDNLLPFAQKLVIGDGTRSDAQFNLRKELD